MPRLVVLLAALAVTGALAATAFAAKTITVGDNYFVQRSGVPTVTVTKGTVVRWVWRGEKTHNVRVTKGPVKFGSSFQKTGVFRKRMRRRGTYTLVCDVHGAADQSMKLVVK